MKWINEMKTKKLKRNTLKTTHKANLLDLQRHHRKEWNKKLRDSKQ